jgi:hypothetical protein
MIAKPHYTTLDGKTFPTRERAETHLVDCATVELRNLLYDAGCKDPHKVARDLVYSAAQNRPRREALQRVVYLLLDMDLEDDS